MTDTFVYDLLEYPSHVHPQMHPARLAAIARLHGIPSASPAQCRLLEVGCGDGLQLLTLAMAYPHSHFVGVDMSHAAIERGDAMRRALGLDNVALVVADLTSWDAGPQAYDFVVAHGFFSWVPDPVRDRLLALAKAALGPAGIAYVSYNALPGCHVRRMVWDMMKFHTRDVADPREQIVRAREFLAWLGNDVVEGKAYAEAVRGEAQDLLARTDTAVLFHDDLAEFNQPFAFSEFAARAAAHGLAYVAEADYHEMSDASTPPEARARLAAQADGDRLLKEQYLDFLKGRRFRQTLLCHADAPLDPASRVDAVRALSAMGLIRGDAGGDPATATTCFRNPNGAALTTDHPVIKVSLQTMGDAFPAAIGFDALLQDARSKTGSEANQEEDAGALARALLTAFEHGLCTLLCDPPAFSLEASERPRASALARMQLEGGADLVTSLRPSMVRIDSRLALELIRLLDGQRDRAALLHDLSARMSAIPVPQDDGSESLQSVDWWRERLAPQLEDGLAQTARMALLLQE